MKNKKRFSISRFFLIIILLLTGFFLLPYLISPVYDFAEPKPFSGNRYYNPYQQLEDSWEICIFHTHSRSWGAFTDGKDAHIDSVFDAYHKLKFSYVGISNYQTITPPTPLANELNFTPIPTYEHGLTIHRSHQLCLGTDKVTFFDFLFFQSLNHKQFILNILRPTTDFLSINHPKFFNSYKETDFTYLSNYDAIEVSGHYRTSVPHWDSALSSGYYASVMVNDDMHELDKMGEIGANFTVVNTKSLSRYDITEALKARRHYGVRADLKWNEGYPVKIERIDNLIHPKAIEMKGDTLVVQLDTMASVIKFVGQNGEIKDSAVFTNSAQYIFNQTDTYIRIELNDLDKNIYFFNPVVRSEDNFVLNTCRAEVNSFKTHLKRISIILVLCLFICGIQWKNRKNMVQKIKLFFQTPYRLKLLILIGLYTIARFYIAASLELTNDEVYYRLYALYPDFSHFDHPPMVGFLIQLTTLNLLFDSALFIRLGAIILGCITVVFAFKIGEKIHSVRAGFVAAMLFCISPYVFLLSGTFILPDTPLLFFWMISLWLIINIFEGKITTKKANHLLTLGLLIGLACLSKYTAIFLWVGVGFYILFYKRIWLKKWQLYAAILLTMCCLIPVLYWNMQNNFISFSFHGERVTLFSKICYLCLLREIIGEFFYNNPFLFVMTYIAFYHFCFRKKSTHYTVYNRIFYCIGIPVILLFLFFSLFREILPHWNSPGYVTLIFPVAIYIAEKLKEGKQGLWRETKIWMGLLAVLIVLFLLQVNYNILKLSKLGVKDMTLELATWKKMGVAFAELSQNTEKEGKMPPGAPIIATRWFPAANLDMYVAKPTNRKVLAIGEMERIHKYYWINASRGGFYLRMDAWYITDDYDFISPEHVADYFEIILPPDTLQIIRNHEMGKNLYVYQLKNMLKLP